jgi:hypothetical protein
MAVEEYVADDTTIEAGIVLCITNELAAAVENEEVPRPCPS